MLLFYHFGPFDFFVDLQGDIIRFIFANDMKIIHAAVSLLI